MYGLIHLADGSTEYVPNADRFERMVYDKLGRDAADIVAELIRQGDVAAHRADSEFQAYERENEALMGTIVQASEDIAGLADEVRKAARLDRRKIAERLTKIERALDAMY